MESTVHGDMTVVATADTNQMEWTPSPSGSVHRKRVHLVGPAESGQVTSVVRYEPMSKFPPHDHPEGEEILVLEGVFPDEHGDWPAGTYLLNPEGFRHSPFSDPGCVIFVKLRQFAGLKMGRSTHGATGTASRGIRVGPLQRYRSHPMSSTRCGRGGRARSARFQNEPRSEIALRCLIGTLPSSARASSIIRLHPEPHEVSCAA
jgi:hypothetical protein